MSHARVWSGTAVAVALIVSLTGCGAGDGDADGQNPGAAEPAPGSDSAASDGATGTITFGGVAIEPIDRLQCGSQGGEPGVFGVVGEGEFLTLRPDRATYEDGDIIWVAEGVGNEGNLTVTDTGAQGALQLYEQGTANDLDDPVFTEIVVDVTC